MNLCWRILWIFLSVFFISYDSSAQDRAARFLQEEYRVGISVTSEKITIDGKLDEGVWQSAEMATQFWMSSPIDGERADAAIQTEVRLTYDDQYIYIGAKCLGGGPYVMPSLKRDAQDYFRGDILNVVFDPVNQQTNGFAFGTNTAGVQFDALISGQTGRRGSNGGGGINRAWDNIWLSEAQLYDDYWTVEMAIQFKSLRYAEKEVWGINFVRGHPPTNSFQTWSPVPVQFRSVDLGYMGALVWDQQPPKEKSNISLIPYALTSTFNDFEEGTPSQTDLRIGGDAKVAITSSLNLDVAINPDFSQVDVDEQVTNLTTVNIRFPERRLFFLENSDLFSDFGIPPMRPFFSRSIGLDDDGNAIPIAYGARLSGNLNKDLRIGLMNLQTKSNEDFLGQNYTSFALHQRVLKRSTVKGYFHNRQAYDEGFVGDDYNRTAGLEFSYRSGDGRWQAFSGFGKSWSPELEGDNHFYNVAVGFDSREFGFYSNISGVGNNYRADMGFIPRFSHYDEVRDTSKLIGFHHGFTRMSYSNYPEDNNMVNMHRFSVSNVIDYAKDGWDLIQNKTTLSYNLNLANSSNVGIEVTHEQQGLLFPFGFTDDAPLPVGVYKFNFFKVNYETDRRKPFGGEFGIRLGEFYNGDRKEYSAELRYRAQPWGNFGLRFVQNELEFPDEYGSESLTLIGPRGEFNFSRNLFWTTFLQYNTQAENFNINSRLQWRFKPQSDIFLVYSDNYDTDGFAGKNRGVVLKMNYWLNL